MNAVKNLGNVNPSGRGMNGNVYDPDGLSPTLTTNKGEGIKIKSTKQITMIGGLQKHQSPRTDGICPCINSAAGMGGGQTPIAIRPSYRVRKLTQKECWRLMGFDDDDFEKAKARMNNNLYSGKDRSGSQLYKQAGNSIVVDVLQRIMAELYTAMPYLFEDIEVGSFFSGIGAFEKALERLEAPSHCTSPESCQPINEPELEQIGYINNYNGDANRVYDSTIARALKAEAGGGRSENRLVSSQSDDTIDPKHTLYGATKCRTICINSKVNGKQPSLQNRIYDPTGVSTAITTSQFFMPLYKIEEPVINIHQR